MKKNIFLVILAFISTSCIAQIKIEKPTAVFVEMGGVHRQYSFHFNRVYSIRKKVAFSYEFGASRNFGYHRPKEFNPAVSVGWSALLLNKNNSHLELGIYLVLDEYTEGPIATEIGYRYQNFDNPGLFVRFSIVPLIADGSGVYFSTSPGFGVGYSF